jgi:hypothetical protein
LDAENALSRLAVGPKQSFRLPLCLQGETIERRRQVLALIDKDRVVEVNRGGHRHVEFLTGRRNIAPGSRLPNRRAEPSTVNGSRLQARARSK